MKITFVGTSHGVPAADRFCTSMMIEIGESYYFIDAGAPLADMVLRMGKHPNDFKALFTSHAHSDHTFGLIFLAELMGWYYKGASGDFFITTEEHIGAIRDVITTAGTRIAENRIRFKLAEEGVVYEDENIKVEYIKTEHANPSYAILVTAGEKRVLFGGDMSSDLHDMPDVIKSELDLFVAEMAHQAPSTVMPHLDTCKAKRVAFIHVWPLDKYNAIEDMKKRYPFEILTPADGDTVEV